MGALAFSPDGRTPVSGAADTTARLLPRLCAATAGPHDRELRRRQVPGTLYAPGCG
ncbi:hypothetical protein [Streptomyces sp. NRRL S-244]|uniref:hypothetical protein n=1 Tax=Streptomyces sp. NRRL S-244 TaxID=1463897 RepID=UPI000AAF85EE|nr:hypothetical protein [Streptomyces sp. NRRL S-244]